MSSKKLKRIGLSSDILDRLSKGNIHTCKDLLSRTNLELLKFLGLGYVVVEDVVQRCSRCCAPKPITSLDLWNKRKDENSAFFATSLPDLDKVLHGGLPRGTITEIAGPSGCGKTQFCMMLCVQATVGSVNDPTREDTVLYIDTESAFSAERLIEIAQTKHRDKHPTDDYLMSLISRVLVDNQQTCSGLITRLEGVEEDIIGRRVKLLIVDSVASLVRKEYSGTLGRNLTDRTNFLSRQAALLKYIAETFNIPVVVTNQITTRFGYTPTSGQEHDDLDTEGDSGYVTAALGNTWSHSVNTRLILQYITDKVRQVMVAKSPVAPFTSFDYRIQAEGVVQTANQKQMICISFVLIRNERSDWLKYLQQEVIFSRLASVFLMRAERQALMEFLSKLKCQEVMRFLHCNVDQQ